MLSIKVPQPEKILYYLIPWDRQWAIGGLSVNKSAIQRLSPCVPHLYVVAFTTFNSTLEPLRLIEFTLVNESVSIIYIVAVGKQLTNLCSRGKGRKTITSMLQQSVKLVENLFILFASKIWHAEQPIGISFRTTSGSTKARLPTLQDDDDGKLESRRSGKDDETVAQKCAQARK